MMATLDEQVEIEWESQEQAWADWDATSEALKSTGLIKSPEPRRTREQIRAQIVSGRPSAFWKPKGWMHKAGYGS